jgi:hypothetical protein
VAYSKACLACGSKVPIDLFLQNFTRRVKFRRNKSIGTLLPQAKQAFEYAAAYVV